MQTESMDEMYRTLGRFRWRTSRYRSENARLTKIALQAKIARGERAGNIPYGYRVESNGRTLVACEAEQATLAVLRELHRAGFTLRRIADELNHRGYRTRRGTEWRFQYVAALKAGRLS